MKLDKSIAVLAMVASLVLAAGTAAAQDNQPTQSQISDVENLDEYFSESSDSVDLDGGNVTQADLSSEQSTDNWAGLYGNASGTLVLGAGTDGDVLYDWDASADSVFAASDDVVWSNITDGYAGTVDGFYDITGSDDANATFTANTNETVDVSETEYEGSTALTNGDSEEAWSTIVLEDNSSDEETDNLPVFAGIVGEGDAAFNGDEADYQMILPAEDENPRSFDMYLELS